MLYLNVKIKLAREDEMHKTSRPGISTYKGHPHQIMTVMKWRLSRPNRTRKPIYTMDMTTEKNHLRILCKDESLIDNR